MRHFAIAALYSLCTAAFFAALLRRSWATALRFFAGLLGVMIGSVLVIGWLMRLLSP